MKDLKYNIANEAFVRFPEYRRRMVLVYDVHNGASPDKLVKILRDEEAAGKDVMELVERFCGGRVRFEILSRQNPQLILGGD